MWKMCIQKILNVNLTYFNSLTSVIAEFPTSIFTKEYWTICLCSFYFPVHLARFSNCIEKFKRRKKYYYLLEFDEWTETATEESVLQKEVFFNTVALQSIKLFVLSISLKKIQWRGSILLKLLTYSLQL